MTVANNCVRLWKMRDQLRSPSTSTYALTYHLTVQVCTIIARIILRCHYHNIYIRISFSDINDDFVPPSRRYLTFEPMNPESCVTIAIRNSVDFEMPESFFVSLQKPSGLDDRISINTDKDEMEVEILDDSA